MKRISLILLTIVVVLVAGGGVDASAKTKRGTTKRSVSTQSVKRAYIKKVNSLAGFEYDGYFLTDITGDGIPELWVKYGTCEADYMLDVYTYTSSGLKRILRTGAGHTGYYGYRNGKYVIAQMAHMGYEVLSRITYSGGKLHEKTYYESPGEVEDYTQPKEPHFDYISFRNSSAINHLF